MQGRAPSMSTRECTRTSRSSRPKPPTRSLAPTRRPGRSQRSKRPGKVPRSYANRRSRTGPLEQLHVLAAQVIKALQVRGTSLIAHSSSDLDEASWIDASVLHMTERGETSRELGELERGSGVIFATLTRNKGRPRTACQR